MNVLNQQILNSIMAFIADIVLVYLDSAVIECKYGHKGKILLAVSILSGTVIKTILGNTPKIFIGIVLIYMVYTLLIMPTVFFKGNKVKNIFVCTAMICVQMMSEAVAVTLLRPNKGYDLADWSMLDLTYVYLLTFSTFIVLGILMVYILRTLSGQKVKLYYVLCFLYLFSMWFLYLSYSFNFRGLWTIIGMAISIFTVVLLIYYMLRFDKNKEVERELKEVKAAMEMEKKYYSFVEEQQDIMSKIRHDYMNQLTAVTYMVERGETEEAKEIIDELMNFMSHVQLTEVSDSENRSM